MKDQLILDYLIVQERVKAVQEYVKMEVVAEPDKKSKYLDNKKSIEFDHK